MNKKIVGGLQFERDLKKKPGILTKVKNGIDSMISSFIGKPANVSNSQEHQIEIEPEEFRDIQPLELKKPNFEVNLRGFTKHQKF